MRSSVSSSLISSSLSNYGSTDSRNKESQSVPLMDPTAGERKRTEIKPFEESKGPQRETMDDASPPKEVFRHDYCLFPDRPIRFNETNNRCCQGTCSYTSCSICIVGRSNGSGEYFKSAQAFSGSRFWMQTCGHGAFYLCAGSPYFLKDCMYYSCCKTGPESNPCADCCYCTCFLASHTLGSFSAMAFGFIGTQIDCAQYVCCGIAPKQSNPFLESKSQILTYINQQALRSLIDYLSPATDRWPHNRRRDLGKNFFEDRSYTRSYAKDAIQLAITYSGNDVTFFERKQFLYYLQEYGLDISESFARNLISSAFQASYRNSDQMLEFLLKDFDPSLRSVDYKYLNWFPGQPLSQIQLEEIPKKIAILKKYGIVNDSDSGIRNLENIIKSEESKYGRNIFRRAFFPLKETSQPPESLKKLIMGGKNDIAVYILSFLKDAKPQPRTVPPTLSISSASLATEIDQKDNGTGLGLR